MKAVLQHIRRNDSNTETDTVEATLQLRVDSRSESYVVRVRTDPFLGVEGPSSLWKLLEPYEDGSRNLLLAISHWLKGESTSYPISLGDDESLETPMEKPLWPTDSQLKESLALPELRWAARHLSLDRSNTLFPRPFEHEILLNSIDDLLPIVSRIDLLRHRFSATRTVVAPKSTVGTRVASQLDPLDALLLTGLVYSCGPAVERARIPIGEAIVHSFRFKPEDWGGLWDPEVGYTSFEQTTESQASAGSVDFVVEADVSDFYHRIPAKLVASQLERIGIHPRTAESASRMLRSVSDVGLPVGPSVSAFFAEAVMTAVDNQLLAFGVRYVRFNDDFRLFCRTEVQAREQLVLLSEALATLGLTIQSEKSNVTAAAKFLESRQASRQWWLRRAGNELAAADVYDEVTEKSVRLSHSAKSVLLQCLATKHVAWLKLGRPALRALVPEHKASVINVLLAEIARAWALSSDIAYALRSISEDLDAEPPLDAPSTFVEGVLKAADPHALEFAMIWILHTLQRQDWPGREPLAILLNALPPSAVARRELYLAIDGIVDHPALAEVQKNRWAQRCDARSGYLNVRSLKRTPDASPSHRFHERMLAAIQDAP